MMFWLNTVMAAVRLFEVRRQAREGIGMEALKSAASKVVGTKQVLRGLKAGTLRRVYVANDSDTFLYQRIVTAAEAAHVPVIRVATMKELGENCGIQVATAAAAIGE